MLELLSGQQVAAKARELFLDEQPQIAVAFWGIGAAEALGLLTCSKEPKIVCNLLSGGTNPEEIAKLQDALKARFGKNFRIKHNSRLHAKTYLSPKGAIIGSSNASANGLSMEGRECSGWIETNVYSPDASLISETQEWFDDLWHSNETKFITKEDIEQATILWKQRRQASLPRGKKAKRIDLLDELKSNPEKYSNRRLFICLYSEDLSEEAALAEQEKKEEQIELGKNPDHVGIFEGWPSLPDDADLICFSIKNNKAVSFDKIWHTPRTRESFKLKKSKRHALVSYRSDLRLQVSLKKWQPLIAHIASKQLNKRKSALCMELGEVTDKYRSLIAPSDEAETE